ncbi:MAG: VOC family protein [Pseudomonadota bacterium]
MIRLVLDHLAVSTINLEDGTARVEDALGVALSLGGQHPHYGTHNRLLGLEDGLYLEVIAIDPQAPAPSYPRWFDLDRFSGPPALTHWICRTGDIAGFVSGLPEAGIPVALSRGDLRWQMSVPPGGALPYDNRFPPVIEWATSDHPAARLPASGCRLKRLIVQHPDAKSLERDLTPYFFDERLQFETGMSALRAEFETPTGLRILE